MIHTYTHIYIHIMFRIFPSFSILRGQDHGHRGHGGHGDHGGHGGYAAGDGHGTAHGTAHGEGHGHGGGARWGDGWQVTGGKATIFTRKPWETTTVDHCHSYGKWPSGPVAHKRFDDLPTMVIVHSYIN